MNRNQPYYVKQSGGGICQKRMNTMIYYLFPKCLIEISASQIHVSRHDNTCNQIISPSQYHYMQEIKTRIQACEHWNRVNLNPYAILNDISNIANVNLAFYEILELYSIMHFSWTNFYKLNTLHFGKNGDMTAKAFQYIRNCPKHDSNTVIVDSSKNHHLDHTKKIDVAFCDASLCDHEYENGIEILKQFLVVLVLQKQKGACIIKVGDTYTLFSLDIISFMSHFYEKTYFMKPSVSDLTTCEKFIVCKNFLHDKLSEDVLKTIFTLHTDILNQQQNHPNPIQRIFRNKMPLFVSSKLEEINSIFGQPRLEYISQLITQTEKHHDIKNNNKRKCVDWCSKYLL